MELITALHHQAEELVALGTQFGHHLQEELTATERANYQQQWAAYQQAQQQRFDYYGYRLLTDQYWQLHDRLTALNKLSVTNPEIPELITPVEEQALRVREDQQWATYQRNGWPVPLVNLRQAPTQFLQETLQSYLTTQRNNTTDYPGLAERYTAEELWQTYQQVRGELTSEAGTKEVQGPLAATRYALFRNRVRQRQQIDDIALINLLFCTWNEELELPLRK